MPAREALAGEPGGARLRISEIFLSLQGEADAAGWPTVFVRLTGCPLRCHYCDTSYAFSGGESMSIDAVLQAVADYHTRHVCVTGGEPLAQKECIALLGGLCDAGYEVSLETSGALDISRVDPRVSRVMDLKTPSSGEAARNRYENIAFLTPRDQVKLVIGDRNDYEWARAVVEKYRLDERCAVLFSPSFGSIEPRQLAEWILEDRLAVRFQMQLHKLLWGDEQGR
ncbi:MAG TPA: 7-carboxy-7-deazaguanine synthase QueE [Gammaproteobacteria bacterium]